MNVMTRLVCSSFYLDEDAFEGGSNGDGAEFDEEVARLEARPACLDLGLLLGLVKARHLEHEQVEERVGHQRHLVRRLEKPEHQHLAQSCGARSPSWHSDLKPKSNFESNF